MEEYSEYSEYSKFNIPIYGGEFWVCFTDDFIKSAAAIDVHLRVNANDCNGLTCRIKDGEVVLMFIKNDKIRPEVIGHEALHVVNYVFVTIGVHASVEADEHQAYFMDWVIECAYRAAYNLKKRLSLNIGTGQYINLLWPIETEVDEQK